MTWVLAGWLCISGVVDQIDAGLAWIEWDTGAFTHVPLRRLPRPTVEGDTIAAHIRNSPSGAARREDHDASAAHQPPANHGRFWSQHVHNHP